MKKILLLLCIAAGTFMTGCSDVDELAPTNQSLDKTYILPQAKPLTQQERDIIKARRQAYYRAIGRI